MSNFNRRVVFNANHNPINPALVQVAQMTATAEVEGRNTVKIYTDATTYSEDYDESRLVLAGITDKYLVWVPA